MTMRRWVAVGLLGLGLPAVTAQGVSLFRPNIGVPAFALTGGVFNAEVQASAGLSTSAWSAVILNDLRSWTCQVEGVEYGNVVYGDSLAGYRLRVRVPGDAPQEVFKLVISHPDEGATTNRHCLSLLSDFESPFYILHYADPQVETVAATAANGAGGGHGSLQSVEWAATAFNLIHPRFLFNTGDEVENGVAGYYPLYLNAIEQFASPLLITRGNNDVQGDFSAWKRDIGPPTFSITMGSFYVGMKDYGANEILSWFTNDYAGSFTNDAIRYRLFGQHFNSGGQIYSPPAGQYPDLMLVGHNHTFTTLSSDPYPILSSGPAWNYGNVGIFEFTRSGEDWACSNIAIHGGANKLNAFGDWGAPRLVTNSFLHPNSGAEETNTAYIVNSLNYDFQDGRVRFLMRKTDVEYRVSGGEKIGEYEYAGTGVAVLVRVNIQGAATTVVTVSPMPEEAPPSLWIASPSTGPVYRTSLSNLFLAGGAFDGIGLTAIVYAVEGPAPSSGTTVTGRVVLIPAGATWQYRDDGSDQGSDWRSAGFDDHAWAGGPAELGYGDGDEATVVGYGGDTAHRYITTYFRHELDLADCPVWTNSLQLSVKRDDGILVYLNGTECYRNNMPDGLADYRIPASALGDEHAWFSTSIQGLSASINVVCAEIHQANETSSDISFDLELSLDLGDAWLIPGADLAAGTNRVFVTAYDTAGQAATGVLEVVVCADADGDGMNDDWEQTFFGGAGSEPGLDPDEDGSGNLDEFIAGTDPTNSTSFMALAQYSWEGYSCLEFWSRSNRFYTVWFATNLLWPVEWHSLTGGIAGTDQRLDIVDDEPGIQRYYRLQVDAP